MALDEDEDETPTSSIRLFPGFPLPATDYAEFLAALDADGGPGRAIVVAHSRGALDALVSRSLPHAPLFLLAPSVPRRRWGTPLLRASLSLAGSIPVLREEIALRLRVATYRRYGAEVPSGPPLDLTTAARRLRLRPPPSMVAQSDSRPVVVVISTDDPRHADQALFALQLGATVLHHPGGHLFPITHPASAASTIRAALTSG